jgi:hypothetical protein
MDGSRPTVTLMPALLSLFVLTSAGGLAVWLVLKGRELQRRHDLERRVLARKQGWDYEGRRFDRVDYRFTGGTKGIDWQMWYDSDRGDKSPTPRAYWCSANLRTRELALVILGRKRFRLESGTAGQLLMGVVSGVVHAISGRDAHADKVEFYQSAVEITTGRTTFREAFAVAVAPELPTTWLDAELQSLLLDWPVADRAGKFRAADSIEITLRADGLKVVVLRMPQDTRCWAHLASLGQALALRLVEARGT